MKIVVCVRWGISVDNAIKAENGSIVDRGLCYVVNPYDLIAVREAVCLKEAANEGEVTVVCIGPPAAEKGLRRCLALGANKGIIIWDNACENSDNYATALVLAEAIKHLKYDIVLCGHKFRGLEEGQLGAMLAEFLDIPMVPAVVKIEVANSGHKLIVQQKLEGGNRQLVEIPIPALLTAEIGLNESKYPRLKETYAAQEKVIERLGLEGLGLDTEQVGVKGSKTEIIAYLPHKPRPKKTFIPDGNLSAQERVKLLLAGGVTKKQSDLLEGHPGQMVSSLVRFLGEHNLLP